MLAKNPANEILADISFPDENYISRYFAGLRNFCATVKLRTGNLLLLTYLRLSRASKTRICATLKHLCDCEISARVVPFAHMY